MKTTEHIDWLSLTFPSNFPIVKLLPASLREQDIQAIKSPIPVYDKAYETTLGVKILLSSNLRIGNHMILSGKPLERIRANDKNIISELYDLLLESGGKASRVDICVNVLDSPSFTMQAIHERVGRGEHETKLKGSQFIGSGGETETLYLGDRKSKKRRFRFYNKAIEMDDLTKKYVRIEYEKRRGANNMLRSIMEGKNTIKGIIKSVVDFPNWEIYQKIFDIESEPLQRSVASDKTHHAELIARMDWMQTSAIPAIAKLIVDTALDYDTSIENSPALKLLENRLPREIHKYVEEKTGGTHE